MTNYKSITIDISKCKHSHDIDNALEVYLKDGYDVKAMTKDFVICTKLLAK
jgi:hypothetical protein